jgi:hypothetical protein
MADLEKKKSFLEKNSASPLTGYWHDQQEKRTQDIMERRENNAAWLRKKVGGKLFTHSVLVPGPLSCWFFLRVPNDV